MSASEQPSTFDGWIAYCINLERCKERRANFEKWAKFVGLSVEFWVAKDKLTLTKKDYDDYCDVQVFNGYETLKSDGATACRISHTQLAEHLLTNHGDKDYYFILEDDAGFKGDTQEQMDNKKSLLFDFLARCYPRRDKFAHLWFGFHDTGLRQMVPIPDDPIVDLYLRTHLLHAMLLKKNEVAIALQWMTCDDEELRHLPVDWIYDMLRTHYKRITLGPRVNIIEQVDTTSFIWN